MTALFDEPLRITLRPDLYPIETEHPVGMLFGFDVQPISTKSASAQLLAIVCLADGRMVLLPQGAYRIDWRYEVGIDRFVDINVAPPGSEDDQDT